MNTNACLAYAGRRGGAPLVALAVRAGEDLVRPDHERRAAGAGRVGGAAQGRLACAGTWRSACSAAPPIVGTSTSGCLLTCGRGGRLPGRKCTHGAPPGLLCRAPPAAGPSLRVIGRRERPKAASGVFLAVPAVGRHSRALIAAQGDGFARAPDECACDATLQLQANGSDCEDLRASGRSTLSAPHACRATAAIHLAPNRARPGCLTHPTRTPVG